MKALLDACFFVWLNADLEKIPLRIRDICATRDHELYLSAASAWEIAVKWKSGRLILPEEPLAMDSQPARKKRRRGAPN